MYMYGFLDPKKESNAQKSDNIKKSARKWSMYCIVLIGFFYYIDNATNSCNAANEEFYWKNLRLI